MSDLQRPESSFPRLELEKYVKIRKFEGAGFERHTVTLEEASELIVFESWKQNGRRTPRTTNPNILSSCYDDKIAPH